jgi:hypothetical protein
MSAECPPALKAPPLAAGIFTEEMKRAQPRASARCQYANVVWSDLGMGKGEDRHMASIQWTDDFDTACQQAGQDHTLVLLDFFSPT